MLSNYPPGVSDSTIGAPWNEPDVPEKEFDVTCSQTLSRTVSVLTNNYIPGGEWCEYDDGITIGGHDPDDTSDTNWAEEYHANDHYTPLQLIELYKETLKKQLESWEGMEDTAVGKGQIRNIEYLIKECEGWTEDETEYVEE